MPPKLSRLLREIAFIGWLAAAAYVGLALVTYSPADPGPTHSGGGGEILNLGGVVGAWLADGLFALAGYMAYGMLALLCVVVWRLTRRREAEDAPRAWHTVLLTLGFSLTVAGVCALEYLYVTPPGPPSPLQPGGIIGQFVATQFTGNFGEVGGTLMFLAFAITGITLTTSLSWLRLMDRIGYAVFASVARVRAWREQYVDRQAGGRVRAKRRQSVREFRAEMQSRKPPTIGRKISTDPERPPPPRQTHLFPAAGDSGVPPLDLLESPAAQAGGYSRAELESMSELLVKKLKDFGVEISVAAVQPGPVITRFEVEPAPGVKSSRIVGLARDLARSLTVESVRVVDNIAGKAVMGIEIPNQNREIVRLVEGLSSAEYEKNNSPLALVLGKDIAGHPVVSDLIKMPHVLIAGTTGSGKSVCVNALILSIVYKSTPEQVRMIMVDPKFLELSVYDGIPHLLSPVVTDMNKAANALRWCIGEMDRRFRVMAALSVRNIASYNKTVAAANKAGQPIKNPLAIARDDADSPLESPADADAEMLQELPYIVVVVDELADLMMVVGKKIEEIIIRIAQRARAAGIHLILATQRPSVDVVTGLIKANVPTRIAFQVSSRADSRTVLDQMGADQLLGQGDMLFLPPGSGFLQRVHGSFVSDMEVAQVVAHLKSGPRPMYVNEITEGDTADSTVAGNAADADGADPLYDEAVQFVCQQRRASISALQRAFRVGFNRAGRWIERMETEGVVSAVENGRREVLTPPGEN